MHPAPRAPADTRQVDAEPGRGGRGEAVVEGVGRGGRWHAAKVGLRRAHGQGASLHPKPTSTPYALGTRNPRP
jgi:hypothetical protein